MRSISLFLAILFTTTACGFDPSRAIVKCYEKGELTYHGILWMAGGPIWKKRDSNVQVIYRKPGFAGTDKELVQKADKCTTKYEHLGGPD